MSAPASELSSPLVDAYRAHPGRARVDELVDDQGVRPHAEGLAATVEGLGIGGLLAARAEAANQVADEGITYGAAESGLRQPWLVDPLPLPLDAADWLALERGLTQRAVLLDAVLADLYSERTLLRGRVLPAAAVLGHPGFTRTADGIGAANRRQLVLTATDVGRDATGDLAGDLRPHPGAGRRRLRDGDPADRQPGAGRTAPHQRPRPAARRSSTP